MPSPKDNSSVENLVDWIRRSRKYAGFFSEPLHRISGGEKEDKERLIAQLFCSTIPGLAGHDITIERPDPPDCSLLGGTIGIELCELVDSTYANPRTSPATPCQPFRCYSSSDICDALIKIAVTKDAKLIKAQRAQKTGWNYKELILLVYTDEFDISSEKAAAAVEVINIPPLKIISRAYLLLSYSPEEQRYPFFQFI